MIWPTIFYGKVINKYIVHLRLHHLHIGDCIWLWSFFFWHLHSTHTYSLKTNNSSRNLKPFSSESCIFCHMYYRFVLNNWMFLSKQVWIQILKLYTVYTATPDSVVTVGGRKIIEVCVKSWWNWKTMFENLIVPLLFSLLIYLYLPTPETNLLGKISTSYTVRLNKREPSFFSDLQLQYWGPWQKTNWRNWQCEVGRMMHFWYIIILLFVLIRHAFKIIRNVDGHMKHVEIESKVRAV